MIILLIIIGIIVFGIVKHFTKPKPESFDMGDSCETIMARIEAIENEDLSKQAELYGKQCPILRFRGDCFSDEFIRNLQDKFLRRMTLHLQKIKDFCISIIDKTTPSISPENLATDLEYMIKIADVLIVLPSTSSIIYSIRSDKTLPNEIRNVKTPDDAILMLRRYFVYQK